MASPLPSAPPDAPFWWRRYEITKDKREWTGRRLAAARRAVEREEEANALVPELRRFHSVEERVALMDKREASLVTRLRAYQARWWMQARSALRSLSPEFRQRVLARWNTRFMPGSPTNLLSLIRMMQREEEGPILLPRPSPELQS